MKKNILFIIMLLSSCVKEEINIPLGILTKDKLTKNQWSNYGMLFSYGYLMTFKADGTYTEEFIGEGCGGGSGKYTLVGNTLHLIAAENSLCPEDNSFVENVICKLIPESADPFYSESLKCGLASYYGSSLKPVGTNILIKDVESVIIEPRKVLAKTNIMIREKPSIKSKSYNCPQSDENANFQVPYFPKGRELVLYARTAKKEKINNIEDYWYFAQQDLDWYTSCAVSNRYTSMVWVFGGYLN
ncbi:hypothetical protein [Leptospira johnsonii]|nr:hypothetical protein [Leptospira johnsonii]